MSSNQKNNCNDNVTFIFSRPIDAATANENSRLPLVNDNATPGGTLDTTRLAATKPVVTYVRTTLRRYGVAWRDMADAIAEVQADSIEAARTKRMPANAAEWKALAATIAVRWAIDRLREAEVRAKYDAGLCEDANLYSSSTLHWEQRDPVDTKRYLAILKDLFDSGEMPENGAEILWGEAEGVPHAGLAAELGVSENTVRLRLFRMRAKFRAKLAALGMLTLMLLLLGILVAPVGEVATPPPAPRSESAQAEPENRWLPVEDGGTPDASEKSTSQVKRNRALPDLSR
jgi:DNA-directed RNA polymerase specialized sigma24 family protein